MAYSNRGKSRAGTEGEREALSYLKMLSPEYKVYNNVLLRTKGGSTELDILVVSPYGLFVIEVKRYSGLIQGSDADRHWLQIHRNGTARPFYSPILQNEGHLRALSSLLNVPLSCIGGLVYFAGDNIDLSYVNSGLVCTRFNILDRVLSYRAPIFNSQQMCYIIGAIEGANINSPYQRRKHTKYVSRIRGMYEGY